MSARCPRCGRFVKVSDLVPVWGPTQSSGPEEEVCTTCAKAEEVEDFSIEVPLNT